jgi:hypothetical protein
MLPVVRPRPPPVVAPLVPGAGVVELDELENDSVSFSVRDFTESMRPGQ